MATGQFPGALPPLEELRPAQKEFLIEHYKRCEAFWRALIPTIWSIPSLAAAINIGAYSLLFGVGKDAAFLIKVPVLAILVGLNGALMIGLWKHRYMQQMFGQRILAIERYVQIPTIEFSALQRRISGSLLYLLLMAGVFLISLALLVYKLIYRAAPAF